MQQLSTASPSGARLLPARRTFGNQRIAARCTARPMRARAHLMQQDIRLIATDVDGTLLNSSQKLSPAVEEAVRKANELGVPLVVATGKARGPWLQEVLPRLELTTPGVFLQGLIVYDGEGKRLYDVRLPDDVAQDCIAIAKERGLTLTAYCGERILCEATDEHTERLNWYKEPPPEAVGDMAAIVGNVEIHKMMFMGQQSQIDELRPSVEAAMRGRASLTTALSGMLEVLPLGASKGAGLLYLLSYLGVEPRHVMALGDGENDIEMLRMAGLGVAMANAGPKAKAAADVVLEHTNDEDGVARAIMEFVVQPRLAQVAA